MARRKFAFSNSYVRGINGLIGLTRDQAEGLISALQTEQPIYYEPGQLTRHLQSKVAIDPKVLSQIIQALVSLYTTRAVTGLPVSEFVDLACETGQKRGLNLADPQVLERLKQNLVALLEVEGSLAVVSKAVNVVTEQDRIFSQARVVTDLRPVFREDPGASPLAAAVLHTLRIHFHQNGELKSFFVAMDDEDVRSLKEALDRAQRKSATLRGVADSAKIPVINLEREFET